MSSGPLTPNPNPSDALNEGMTRAKNMGVAAGMIVFLLVKFFFVKVLGKRLKDATTFTSVRFAVGMTNLWKQVAPHWSNLKEAAAKNKVKVVRAGLMGLITVLTPLENAFLRAGGVAKERGEVIAHRTTMGVANGLNNMFSAIGGAFSAGFSKPAVQKMMNRLFDILEEAQK